MALEYTIHQSLGVRKMVLKIQNNSLKKIYAVYHDAGPHLFSLN